MRLHWKFVAIINVCTLLGLTIFFAYDYYLARQEMDAAYLENFRTGSNMLKAADLITLKMVNLSQQQTPSSETSDEPKSFEESAREWLRHDLPEKFQSEMANVLDVYVTGFMGYHFSNLEAKVIASMHGREERIEGDLIITIDEDAYEVIKTGAMYVGGIAERDYGKRASAVMAWYLKSQDQWVSKGDLFVQEDLYAIVQVVFSTEDSWSLLNTWRMKHLLYVFAVSLVLQLVVTTIAVMRMLNRPLQQIITAMERAEEGDLEVHESVSYTDPGVGRLLLSLYRMLARIRSVQRERIAELGTLAAGIAHEVRNPLNYIAMTAEYLKRRLSDPMPDQEAITETRESLDSVIEEVSAINEITRRFIELTRPLALERELTDPNELVNSVVASMAVVLREASVEVITDYEPVEALPLDRAKLRQAFLNLLQNAIQAIIPREGRIYITTRTKLGITGRRLLIEIRDTGPGMPSHVSEHIFEAYFTTRETEGGLGLGLTITRQIIHAHDGQIEVRSQEGMGTVFSITLPIVHGADGDDSLTVPPGTQMEESNGSDIGRG